MAIKDQVRTVTPITVSRRYGAAVPMIQLPPPVVSVGDLTDDQRVKLRQMLDKWKRKQS